MNPANITSPPRIGRPRNLWPLGVVLILLVVSPTLLTATAFHERSHATDTPDGAVLTNLDELLGGVQFTTICVIVLLAGLAFRRLAPVLSSMFLSSLSGHVDRGRTGGHLLAGVRRPRRDRHAGTLLEPGRRGPSMRTSLGVTLFVYWMLYLLFVHDFEVTP